MHCNVTLMGLYITALTILMDSTDKLNVMRTYYGKPSLKFREKFVSQIFIKVHKGKRFLPSPEHQDQLRGQCSFLFCVHQSS
jgi:hypothetical protein